MRSVSVAAWDAELQSLPWGKSQLTKRFANDHAREAAYLAGIAIDGEQRCRRRRCVVKSGREGDVVLAYAQAVFWRVALSNSTVLGLPAKAVKVLYWREANYLNPLRRRGLGHLVAPIVAQFDVLMGVQFTADIINPSFFPWPEDIDSWATRPFRDRSGLVVHVSSHCEPEPRKSYLAALSKHIQVDVYGRCGRNATPDVPNYKFLLAFENARAAGYATEKLLINPVRHGVVPVYLGAPDIRNLPSIDGTGEPWFIDAAEFSSPEALASRLHRLARDEALWAPYLAYRPRIARNLERGTTPWIFPNAPPPIRDAVDPSLGARSVANASAVLNTFTYGGYSPHGVNRTPNKLLARRAAICRLCDLVDNNNNNDTR